MSQLISVFYREGLPGSMMDCLFSFNSQDAACPEGTDRVCSGDGKSEAPAGVHLTKLGVQERIIRTGISAPEAFFSSCSCRAPSLEDWAP